ncbi:MAG: ABC transporter permease [Microthrixaceae bacterium]
MALLAMVGAVLFGGSLASLAGARRSSTSLDRFLAFSRAEDVFVEPGEEALLDMTEVERLPQVEASNYQSYLAMAPVDEDGRPEPEAAGSINPYLRTPVVGPADALLRRRVIRGRDLDPAEPDEAVVDEELARSRHLVPGSHLRMATYTAAQLPSLFNEPALPAPRGPTVDLLITGVVRTPADLVPGGNEVNTFGSTMELYLSPAFYPIRGRELAVFGPPVAGSGQGFLLRHGDRDLAAFENAVRSLPGGEQAIIAAGGSDSTDAARGARRAIGVETTSLVALGISLAVAGVVLVAQGLARFARGAIVDLASVRAVGGRPVQLVLSAAAPGAFAVSLAVLGAGVVATMVSTLTPIGLGRVAEVSPGVHVDGVVFGIGCAVLLVLGLATALASAVPTVRSLGVGRVDRAPRPSRFASWMASLGAPLGPTLGARFAVDPSGQRRSPLRYATGVGVLAFVVIAGVTTYTTSLDHLVGDRAEQGATWDLTMGNPNASDFTHDDQARLLAHPLVAGASAVVSPEGRASIGGRDVAIAGLDELGGAVGPRVMSGRMPNASLEVALGIRTASRVHAEVGDEVRLRINGRTTSMTVVGIAVLNPGLAFTMEIGEGAVVTVDQARELLPDEPVNVLLARVRPGVDIDDAVVSLAREFTNVARPAPAVEVVNLRRVRALPIALAGAMAGAALALLALALVTSGRERRHEVGVLRALGATRRQVGAGFVWQGLWLYAGALVGVPLGVAAGRIVWVLVVRRLGALAAPQVPVASLGFTAAFGVGVALLLAVGHAAMAVRGSAASGLRAE